MMGGGGGGGGGGRIDLIFFRGLVLHQCTSYCIEFVSNVFTVILLVLYLQLWFALKYSEHIYTHTQKRKKNTHNTQKHKITSKLPVDYGIIRTKRGRKSLVIRTVPLPVSSTHSTVNKR